MSTAIEQRTEAIIDQLLELPVADRPEAAERACAGDTKLLERVRSLLSALPMLDGFMSNTTADAPAMTPVAEQPGAIIGRYKLLQQIGEGGFGVVYMAEQEKPVKRRVALKVIKTGMDTLAVIARFEAERQALALMDHPNIARVLDAGATDTGRPYFVMELVKGIPITEYCDQANLETRTRLELFIDVCRAVQHAHQKGIIHRDLKPSNIMITLHDAKPVVKVIDFGIAKATNQKLTEMTLFTNYGQMIGTPAYMSPEQAVMSGLDVDTRSDVYSLGVLLYELLAGSPPFDAQTLRKAGFDEMRRIIREESPQKPSTRLSTLAEDVKLTVAAHRQMSPQALSRQLNGDLDWIVLKAIEKDRARRYESASAFAQDIERHLKSEPVTAGAPGAAYKLRKFLRRNKGPVAAAAAIALLLVMGTTISTWQAVRATRAQAESDRLRAIAVASEERATEQAAIAETEKKDALAQKATADEKSEEAKATLQFLTDDVLAKASPENTRDANLSKVLVEALITPALKTIDQRFKDQPLVRAKIQITLASTLNSLGRPDLAEPQAKAAWETYRQVLGEKSKDALMALMTYGDAVDQQGRYAEAERLDKQLWDAGHMVGALMNYANAIDAQGRHAEAEPLFKQVWDDCRQQNGDDNPVTLMALMDYTNAIIAQGRQAEAEQLLKQCWDASRRVLGEDHPITIRALNNYANVISAQGRQAEAEPLLKQCWDASRRVLGEDHPITIRALNNYANVISAQGRFSEAESLLKQAWDVGRRVRGDDHPVTLTSLEGYAGMVSNEGRHAEAEQLFKQLWDARRRVVGDDDARTLVALCYYAMAVNAQGRHAEAEPLLRQAADTFRRVSPDDRNCGIALLGLGECLANQDKWPQAEPMFRETLAWYQAHPEITPRTNVPLSLQLLNMCLKHEGKPLEEGATTRPTTQTVVTSTTAPAAPDTGEP